MILAYKVFKDLRSEGVLFFLFKEGPSVVEESSLNAVSTFEESLKRQRLDPKATRLGPPQHSMLFTALGAAHRSFPERQRGFVELFVVSLRESDEDFFVDFMLPSWVLLSVEDKGGSLSLLKGSKTRTWNSVLLEKGDLFLHISLFVPTHSFALKDYKQDSSPNASSRLSILRLSSLLQNRTQGSGLLSLRIPSIDLKEGLAAAPVAVEKDEL